MSRGESREAQSDENQRLSSHAHSVVPHGSDRGGEGGGAVLFWVFFLSRPTNVIVPCGRTDSLNDGRASRHVGERFKPPAGDSNYEGNKTAR